MADIDLTPAVEAATQAGLARFFDTEEDVIEAAVRAAAPIIERAVREDYEREIWMRINRWQDDPETRLTAFAISHIDLDAAHAERDLARSALDAVLPILRLAKIWADGLDEIRGFADRQADLLAAARALPRGATDA